MHRFKSRFFNTNINIARIAQLVEHDLAKVGVAGSSPVSRSGREKGDEKPVPMTIGKSRFSLREREREREACPDNYREVPPVPTNLSGFLALFLFKEARVVEW